MRKDVDTQQVVVMYCEQHLTCRQIGAVVGMSGAAVMERLHRAGVDSSQGERVMVRCSTCGKGFSITRSRWKVSGRKFCSNPCYFATRQGHEYHENRHGQRIGRATAERLFRQLNPGEVVHHKDSNCKNNDPSNLMVFASQSDHMRHHHGVNSVAHLWDGATLQDASG